jgi:hypothetical protein
MVPIEIITSPHKQYFATACPANLESEIPHLTSMANAVLGAL